MTGLVFVDTNVFVYRHDSSDPLKQSRAEQWITLLVRHHSGRLSFQVLQELYTTLTRRRLNFDRSQAREIVKLLTEWRPVAVNRELLDRAWLLESRHLLSWWDALIVAAAQTCGCEVLLTEDLQHGYEFDEVRVIDPFASPDQRRSRRHPPRSRLLCRRGRDPARSPPPGLRCLCARSESGRLPDPQGDLRIPVALRPFPVR